MSTNKYFTNEEKYDDRGKVALLCPHCFNINGYIEYNHNIELESREHLCFQQGTNFYVSGDCCHCGEYNDEFITVDSGISNIIKILNQKDIRTLNCCDGLHKADGAAFSHSSDAYIMFASTRYLPFLEPLPDGWYIDRDLTYNNRLTIRALTPKYDIVELEDWALSRKDITDDDLSFVNIEQYLLNKERE